MATTVVVTGAAATMDAEDTTDAAGEGLQVADLLVADSTDAGLMTEEGFEAECPAAL